MGERPTPDAPHRGKRRPTRAPSCRPHSAQSKLERARAVGLGTGPHARTHSQWVVGPSSPPRWRAVGCGRAAHPGSSTPRQEVPPPGALVPPPQRAKPARKSARCGVGDGSPRPHPPAPTASGYWAPAAHPEGGQSGVGERPTPDAPQPGKRRPPRAPSCRPHSAQSQLARARAVGLGTGPHAHTPPHPQPVGSVPLQSAQRAGSRRWESGPPRRPHNQCRRCSSWAPSCRPHSAQSQLARARAVGLVTGPHARTPPQPQLVGSGPRQPAQRAGSRGWESARPRTPHSKARGAHPGRPRAVPTARKASSQERALWGW